MKKEIALRLLNESKDHIILFFNSESINYEPVGWYRVDDIVDNGDTIEMFHRNGELTLWSKYEDDEYPAAEQFVIVDSARMLFQKNDNVQVMFDKIQHGSYDPEEGTHT